MQISIHAGDPATTPADLLAIGVYTDQLSTPALNKALDKALGGALKSAAKDQEFVGKRRQRLTLHTLGGRRRGKSVIDRGKREGLGL